MDMKEQFAALEIGETMRVPADDALHVWGNYCEDHLERSMRELTQFRDQHLDTHDMRIEGDVLVITRKA